MPPQGNLAQGATSRAATAAAAPDRRLVAVMLALSVTLVAAHLLLAATSKPGTSDFFVFWSAAKFLVSEPAQSLATIYDPARLAAFQAALPQHVAAFHPFAYPPSMLLLLEPLAWLEHDMARAVWLLLTLAALVVSTGWTRRPLHALALAVAPASLLNIAYGQNGFLTAALLAGGLLQLDRRPWLAGLLLGLLTIKPQLGLVVPVIMLARGAWTAMLAACMTAVALAVSSALILGIEPWLAWAALLERFAATAAQNIDHLAPHLATVPAALVQLGMELDTARTTHLVVAGTILILLARAVRRHKVDERGCATFALLAMPIVAPLGYVYDAVATVPAIILLSSDLMQRGMSRPHERFALLLAWLAPILSAAAMPIGVPVIPIACLAALLIFAGRTAVEPAGVRAGTIDSGVRTWRQERGAGGRHLADGLPVG